MQNATTPWIRKYKLSDAEARKLRVRKLETAMNAIYLNDVKPVWTPYDLVREMLSGISVKDQDLLVFSDLGFLLPLKDSGADFTRITLVAHSPAQELLANQMRVGRVLQVGYNEPIKELERLLMGLKFDIVVGNPPYKAGMHLSFLKLGFEHLTETGEMVFVHPAEWLVQRRCTTKAQRYADLKTQLEGHVKAIKFFDNPWAAEGVFLNVPLGISYLSATRTSTFTFTDTRTTLKSEGGANVPFKNKKQFSIETSINNFTPWGDSSVITSLLGKVETLGVPSVKSRVKIPAGGFYVNLAAITANGWNTATYYDGVDRKIINVLSIIGSTWEYVTTEPGFAKSKAANELNWVSFGTELEAQNFLSYVTKNKLIKALCVIYKIDQNVGGTLDMLPFLDQNVEWDDKKTYDFFGFTDQEIAVIDDIIEMINHYTYTK